MRLPPSLAVWDHQRGAIDASVKYIEAFHAGRTSGAGLVHLPTGTGKSGVIAVLARLHKSVGCVLVLTPRIALRDQLAADIDGRFFERLIPPFDTHRLPKKVHRIDGEPRPADILAPNESVFVCTIQLFHRWFSEKHKFFGLLRDHVQLVLVDEGHYEPATNWQNAIRALTCPKILFTATPYRNDLKLFDVDFQYVQSFSHADATKQRYLRALTIHQRSPHNGDPARFVVDILDFYDQQFPSASRKPLEARPRVIIRCDSHDQIRLLGAAFIAKGQTVVGVHERFRGGIPGREWERKRVPQPAAEPALIWIHQFKMLEGIDDERIQVIAAFTPLSNARSLIQQVGRALRNRERKARQTAHLLDHASGKQQRLWDGYLAFDEHMRDVGAKDALLPAQKMFRAWLDGVPSAVYLDGRFRHPFSLGDFSPDDLLLPRTTNAFKVVTGFSIDSVVADLEAICTDGDLAFKTWKLNATTAVCVYIVTENSPLLAEAFFMDTKLAVVLVKKDRHLAFAVDTGGMVLGELSSLDQPLGSGDLERLFSESAAGRITQVSVRNSNIAADAVRTRSVSARAIQDTVPYPDDRSSVCTTLEGYAPRLDDRARLVRRYLGLGRARITDHQGGYVPLSIHIDWLERLAKELRSSNTPRAEFARYARGASPPSNPSPTHVLLDLGEALDRYVCTNHPTGAEGEALAGEDWCASTTKSGSSYVFPIELNGSRYDVQIVFDAQRARYELSCAALDEQYRSTDAQRTVGLIRFINEGQAFRVLPVTPGYFYTLGNFFRPDAVFGAAYEDQLGLEGVLHPLNELATMASEKGDTATKFATGSWPSDCLFGMLDEIPSGGLFAPYSGNPDILVCDDLGTEAADFILADTRAHKVAFIHAKASKKKRQCSASAMTEVVGQAVKNAKFASKFNDADEPEKAAGWHKAPWKLDANSLNRVRRGTGTGSEIWGEVRRQIRDPMSDVEVWLVVGQILSKAKFRALLAKSPPEQEAVQLAYLLLSAASSINAVGAKLRVFCSP